MDNIFECDAPRSKGRKQGLINTRLIIYILGVLVLVEAGLFALCAGVSLLYEEPDYIYFVQTMGINIALGGSMVLVGKRTDNLISRRDGYCIVSVSWLLFTVEGNSVAAGGVVSNVFRILSVVVAIVLTNVYLRKRATADSV